MGLVKLQGRRRYLVGAGLAVVVTAAWLWWSRQVTAPLSRESPRGPEPFVQLAKADSGTVAERVLQERADFFDPAPLFLPTPRNYYGARGLPAELVRQPGQLFGDFGAKYYFGEGSLAAYGTNSGMVPESVAEVLSRANEAPFAGFGEQAGGWGRLAARGAVAEFKHLSKEELQMEMALPVEPPQRDFAPMVFVVVVSAGGMVGEPLLTAGSGAPEVDAFFQDYLAKTHRVGERLPPGRYRVTIGP